MAKLLRGIGVALATFVLAIGAIEVTLRVWARLEGRRLAEQVIAVDPENRPIVAFCGDSNIYGVYVEPEETLPRAVQRLSVRDGSKGIRTINLGVPGNASWDVLEHVRRALVVKPAAIVVTCGINNLSVLPTDEGLGIFEALKITKMIRRQIANHEIREKSAKGVRLTLGPDGKEIDGTHILLSEGRGAVIMTDREGNTQVRTAIGWNPGNFQAAEPRMRRDFEAMVRECQAVKVPLVFATYLAGEEGFFLGITELMRDMADADGIFLADCARWLQPAIEKEAKGPFGPRTIHLLQNARSRVLVTDNHPTPLGYEVEARVVAKALKGAGVLPGYEPEDPLTPLENARVTIPSVHQSETDFQQFTVETEPGDEVTLLIGPPGLGSWFNVQVPVDLTKWKELRSKYSLTEVKGTAGPDGRVTLAVLGQILSELPSPVWIVAATARGGLYGSARRFLSPPLAVKVPS